MYLGHTVKGCKSRWPNPETGSSVGRGRRLRRRATAPGCCGDVKPRFSGTDLCAIVAQPVEWRPANASAADRSTRDLLRLAAQQLPAIYQSGIRRGRLLSYGSDIADVGVPTMSPELW
jgi:hypothetical protein